MVRITEQPTKKVSVLNKNSGIRNTNHLLEDSMGFSFHLLQESHFKHDINKNY